MFAMMRLLTSKPVAESAAPRSVGNRMATFAVLAAASASALGLAALAWPSGGTRAEPATVTLASTSWTVTSVTGFEGTVPGGVALVFEAGGRFGGSGGCNRVMGSYTQSGGALSLGEVARTRKMCPPPVMAFEEALLAAMSKVTAVGRTAGGEVVMSGTSGRLIALK